MLFNYDRLSLRYEPFPIGLARPLLSEGVYGDLCAAYPPQDLFAYMPKVGHKYALSEMRNRENYFRWLRAHPVWRELHDWVKGDDFIYGVMAALRQRDVDLGFEAPVGGLRRAVKRVRNVARGRHTPPAPRLSARLEFSMLPAAGGYVTPHTDSPGKIVTIVVSMVGAGEWDPALGGGTDVNRPRDSRLAYNELNRKAGFEEMEVLHTFEFEPNQAVIFVKTFNSWHSVRPMTGENGAMRRTLTINIETHR